MQPEMVELLADTAQYTAVAFIGAFIGIGELVSRYKDDPYEAITNRHAITYTLLNVLASLLALLALKTLNPADAQGVLLGEGPASARVGYTLVAGFGAMGLLRSSAFNMRVGNEDIAIGPSALLQVMLSATDRAVDRARARVRAEMMARTMHMVPFEQLEVALPQLAFAMMQNVTDQEKQDFANVVSALREKKMDAVAKSISLGLALSNIVGQGVVDDAVMALRKTLAAAGDPSFSATLARPLPTPVETPEASVSPTAEK
ncbi:MAG TPA: hypothetical protein VFZ09_42850 [Archangium sp.]|uniref:hypothetical protein n=1 Tax=Archangium sp. TaxID=1872627 RepID=UPI002E310610|nr:hypothetical protein [Archangium sp.]HEX5753018.1 hypothetical protein [Archangium sp.]